VYRDLKPENLLVTGDGYVKLVSRRTLFIDAVIGLYYYIPLVFHK